MKFIMSWLIVSTIFTIHVNGHDLEKTVFPKLSGPYLGQESPGKTAKIFAPGVISTELHDDASPAFNEDGTEVFFRIVFKSKSISYGKIFTSKLMDGLWSKPVIAPFCDKRMWGRVNFAPDGQRLYTSVNTAKGAGFDMDPVYVDLVDDRWEDAVVIKDLRTSNHEFGMFETRDSQMHWTSEDALDGSIKRHYTAQIAGKGFSEIKEVHTFPEGAIIDCFAPDGSYAIFSKNVAPRDRDLFVSFREISGEWSDPVNLGPSVNSERFEKSAAISMDGKYLFFVSNRRGEQAQPKRLWDSELFTELQRIWRCDVYWVETTVIDDLKREYWAGNN